MFGADVAGVDSIFDITEIIEAVFGKVHNLGADNGRFLRHRFSPKPTSVATQNSLPKRIDVAKEAVSAAVANQHPTTERTNPQTERCSKDEAAALRKNHVSRRLQLGTVCVLAKRQSFHLCESRGAS